ncbi:MAG: tRNA pseudouridine(55) synthase TruB [Gemmataceae bacterium]|nr:tRNA pseudouridine(55) synthase TruB [Gemmataceae bacterium]
MEGLLVLDKPTGLTSRAALDRAARWFPRRTPLGHTGTLDPLATGVLVACVGPATRLADYIQRMGKAYRSLFRLGETSDTDDADGTVAPTGAGDPGEEAVREALARFVGRLEQAPPAYSAAHVEGKRAYSLARRGQEVKLEPRPVDVHGIDVLRYGWPELEVEVHCGKGTYIRSLARDLGAMLGVGGHVSVLRRTRVGPFVPEMATPWDAEAPRLLPMGLALAGLPAVELSPEAARRMRTGQAVPGGAEGECAAFCQGRVVAVCLGAGGLLRPVKVLGGVSPVP